MAFSRSPAGPTLTTIPNQAVIPSEARNLFGFGVSMSRVQHPPFLTPSPTWLAQSIPDRTHPLSNNGTSLSALFPKPAPHASDSLCTSPALAERLFRFGIQIGNPPILRLLRLSPYLANRLVRGSADKSRTRHCPSFVVSIGSARYGTGRTRSGDMGSITPRKTNQPETVGRNSRTCFPDRSDHCSSVFSTKKSSCWSQPETSTGYAVCWLAVPAIIIAPCRREPADRAPQHFVTSC